MTLPASPPTTNKISVVRGDQGWYPFAIQQALNDVGAFGTPLNRDGDFGPKTEAAVVTFQKSSGLFPDGEAGPVTQGKFSSLGLAKTDAALPGIPKGLLRGIMMAETGGMLSVVNASVSGGVDCCVMQERVYGPPFTLAKIQHAFSLLLTMGQAAVNVVQRRDSFMTGAWVTAKDIGTAYERAGRLAAFAHNWPTQGGADFYAQNGHVSNPGAHCSWLPKDKTGAEIPLFFPDGTRVATRQDWAEWYAMGGVHGPGRTTKFVTAWQ